MVFYNPLTRIPPIIRNNSNVLSTIFAKFLTINTFTVTTNVFHIRMIRCNLFTILSNNFNANTYL